jgi:hypothetical protein
VTRQGIASRLRRGDLLREHPGVYRVGHRAPSVEATYLADVLAAGEGAVLCGRAAAHLWGLIKGAAPGPEVICPTQRRIEGVTTRRSRYLDAQDVALRGGIPVTSVARTVVDLAAELPEEALARACHEAGVRYGLTPSAVVTVLARRPTTRGARKLRRVVGGDVHVTLSKLEARFLTLLRTRGLPLPVTNRPAGGRRVDCRWPEHRLTIESTVTASTTRAIRGSRIAVGSGRRAPAETTSAATRTVTCWRSQTSCWRSYVRSSLQSVLDRA